MTEIPEHLLKRSRERRGALGVGGNNASGGGEARALPVPANTASAVTAAVSPSGSPERAAAPAPSAPVPPRPDVPVVAAFRARRKIPFWAMSALALLPVWGFMYTRAVTTQAQEAAGPLAEGAVVYASCSSCHGPAGGGVANLGYQFSDGEVLKTFPNIEDQLRFVYFGSSNYSLAGIDVYGDPDREGGAHVTGERGPMPGQGQGQAVGGALEDFKILGVVCHERYELAGASEMPEYDAEFEKWCSEASPLYAALESGGTLATLTEVDDTIIPIGAEPAPASPAAVISNAGEPAQG